MREILSSADAIVALFIAVMVGGCLAVFLLGMSVGPVVTLLISLFVGYWTCKIVYRMLRWFTG
jgi:hypothetical protein